MNSSFDAMTMRQLSCLFAASRASCNSAWWATAASFSAPSRLGLEPPLGLALVAVASMPSSRRRPCVAVPSSDARCSRPSFWLSKAVAVQSVPSRRRTCSMAWRCRFLRPLDGAPDALVDSARRSRGAATSSSRRYQTPKGKYVPKTLEEPPSCAAARLGLDAPPQARLGRCHVVERPRRPRRPDRAPRRPPPGPKATPRPSPVAPRPGK